MKHPKRMDIRIALLVGGVFLGASSYAKAEAGRWDRSSRNLLTNFNNLYGPCVVETEGEYRYKMWLMGWAADHANSRFPGCDAIFHARSKDLLRWEVYCGDDQWDATMTPDLWTPVVTASDRWFEEWHVGDPSVVLKDGVYYMAYSATSKHFPPVSGYPAEMVQCIMGATSTDGIHWTKSSVPLLICAEDTASPPANPDRIGDFHRPCLRWDEGKWRLWFDYFVPAIGVAMGCAENSGDFMQPGGFVIAHDLRKPPLGGWPNPEVIRIGTTYHCFSDPSGYPLSPRDADEPNVRNWKSRQLREAVSPDGRTWQIADWIAPDGDADACHVPQVLLTTVQGRQWLYLFYATQVGERRRDGEYHYEYDRIRAMRRQVVSDNFANGAPGKAP